MVIVAGYIDMAPEERDAFLEGRREAVLATREEPGCLEYAFSADLLEAGRVRIFECWASLEALEAHLGVLAARTEPGAPAPVLARSLYRYEVADAQPLGA
ncbi:MAG TPA: putative quinol monooxygenase [Acidimicrobiales bacterium]|nr:putative quinol monooxygenase [Acidimicrobiales bacterium]